MKTLLLITLLLISTLSALMPNNVLFGQNNLLLNSNINTIKGNHNQLFHSNKNSLLGSDNFLH